MRYYAQQIVSRILPDISCAVNLDTSDDSGSNNHTGNARLPVPAASNASGTVEGKFHFRTPLAHLTRDASELRDVPTFCRRIS